MFPLIGGLASGLASFFGTQSTNQAQEQMQQQQEAYNTQMSNTAYTRASADMKNAGLNPMMMFGGGSAASSPTAPSIQLQNPGNSVQSGISTATSIATQDKVIDNLIADNARIKADTLTKQQEPEKVQAETGVLNTQMMKNKAEVPLTEAETRNVAARLPIISNEAITAKNESGMDSSARRVADVGGYYGHKIKQVLDPAFDLVGSASGLKYLSGR